MCAIEQTWRESHDPLSKRGSTSGRNTSTMKDEDLRTALEQFAEIANDVGSVKAE
jgi:hypothetical protein